MLTPSAWPTTSGIYIAVQHPWRTRLALAGAWCLFLAFYISGLLFYAVSAYAYWTLPGSLFEAMLGFYSIGIAPKCYRSIALAYFTLSLIHAVKCLRLIVPSIQHRQFVLTSQAVHDIPSQTPTSSTLLAVRRKLTRAYDFVFAPDGLFGVSGPCFDLLLLFRELLETILQTIQAYRMSQFLARAWLNRFYVSLLVLNCWLMALVPTLFHGKPMAKVVVTLTCDLVLDFVSSLVVPMTLIALYSKDIVPGAEDWFGYHWFHDLWIAHAISEFQIIIVTSWADITARMVFSLSMVSNLSTLQRLVAVGTRQPAVALKQSRAIVPEDAPHPSTRTESVTLSALKRGNDMVARNSILTKTLRVIFIVAGSAVLALHAAAEVNHDLPQCAMQVRPWGITRPSCSFILINCHRDGITGSSSEMHERLAGLYTPSLTFLIIRHCPALEIPVAIQSLENLVAFKTYNSTIARWDLDAAFTGENHPVIQTIMILRARTIDGKVPLGMQSPDFPKAISSVLFIDTNIREIPNDLDSKWPQAIDIEFDTTELTEIPDTLIRMSPSFLMVAGNQLEHVQREVFEIPMLQFLDLSYTAISELPSDVVITNTLLTSFNLDGTNISSFPMWVDEWLKFPGDILFPQRISAAGSPYCAERDMIFAGELTSFTFTNSSQQSVLMDASTENWDFLQRTVSCVPSWMYRFPIAVDDALAAIS